MSEHGVNNFPEPRLFLPRGRWLKKGINEGHERKRTCCQVPQGCSEAVGRRGYDVVVLAQTDSAVLNADVTDSNVGLRSTRLAR